MRKVRISLLSLMLILAVMLCGCQNNSDSSETNGKLTKSEWAGLLGEKFGYQSYEAIGDFYSDVSNENEYYDEIQACAEWEVFPEKGSFYPNATATWQYAIETAVRAIGIDKLNNSEIGMEVTEDNLIEFFTSKIAGVDTSDLDIGLSKEDAALILTYAYDYATNLTLIERMEYTYLDGVKEVEADAITLNGDGLTATVNDGASYKAGDVIFVQPTQGSVAYAVRVDSVDGDLITYETAGIEDVYEELQVSGTYEATVLNVEPAQGVEITLVEALTNQGIICASYADETAQTGTEISEKGKIVQTGVKKDGNNIRFNTTLPGDVGLTVNISDVIASVDVDYGFLCVKKANATVSFNDSIELKRTLIDIKESETITYKDIDLNKSEEETSEKATEKNKNDNDANRVTSQVPLGSIEFGTGAPTVTIRVSLIANVSIDGEITITYSSQVVGSVNYQKGKGLNASVNNNNASCDFHAEVTAALEPCIKVELRILNQEITNVKVVSGIVAIATVDKDLLGNDPLCIDIHLYVPLRWAINEDSCLMTDWISSKLKISKTIWGSDNSPIQKRFHLEDGELVPECTRGKNEVKTPVVDENGVPYDEYKIFDFEEVVFGFIKVASQSIYLSEGEAVAVGILSVPSG
ncbi:MAG: hypothetical protein J6J86_01475, partial [Lachnospiraceae bacterium]|nr:hypothetical protein [Lachnospiraceae bacterium]